MIATASEMDLVNALHANISEWVRDFRFHSSDPTAPEWIAPEVHKYFLPRRESPQVPAQSCMPQAESLYPAVLILPAKGMDDFDTSANWGITQCTVEIAVRTSDKDMVNRVEFALATIKAIRKGLLQQRTLGKQYRLQLPLHWQVYDNEESPHFGGLLTTTWEFPSFHEQLNF